MEEEWKDLNVEGFEGLYMISNIGGLKGKPRKIWKGQGWHHRPEKVLKPTLAKHGYYVFNLYDNNKKRKQFYIHRLVAQTFLEVNPDKPYVNHKDGNKVNNNINNLEWCTQADNMRHASETGLMDPRNEGSQAFRKKLNEKKVLDIKIKIRDGATITSLAKEYGVTASSISKIKEGRTWKHVKLEDS